MRLVLVGPPGSGKGTQARLLVERLGLRYVGTGDILRDSIRRGSLPGRRADPYIRSGNLVPDDLVNELVNELFHGPDRPEKFVLDGYPRTLAQATWFDRMLASTGSCLDAVVQFARPKPHFDIRQMLFENRQHPRRVRDVPDVDRLPRRPQQQS